MLLLEILAQVALSTNFGRRQFTPLLPTDLQQHIAIQLCMCVYLCVFAHPCMCACVCVHVCACECALCVSLCGRVRMYTCAHAQALWEAY